MQFSQTKTWRPFAYCVQGPLARQSDLDLRAAGALKVDLKFALKLAFIVMSSDRLSIFFQIQLLWLR
jgi:hypothetical protein